MESTEKVKTMPRTILGRSLIKSNPKSIASLLPRQTQSLDKLQNGAGEVERQHVRDRSDDSKNGHGNDENRIAAIEHDEDSKTTTNIFPE
ncbi:hypothetical protein R1flu_007957 [Riccia fluitans]|uniref:Uncharacterized protein n=1 Tax=Riccia fluitans TaxID=41844 RepID=A0ABD1XHT4_9MARC